VFRTSPNPFRSDGELVRIVQSRIEERLLAVHFQIGYKGVPVRHRTPSGPGVKVHTRQTKSRRNQCRSRFAIRFQPLTVQNEFGVKFSWPPAIKHLEDGGNIHTQDVSDGLEVGRKGHNGSHVEIAVCPPVQTVANPLNKGVVYGGMAEGTLNTHRP
jgi:hypothetical protein